MENQVGFNILFLLKAGEAEAEARTSEAAGGLFLHLPLFSFSICNHEIKKKESKGDPRHNLNI